MRQRPMKSEEGDMGSPLKLQLTHQKTDLGPQSRSEWLGDCFSMAVLLLLYTIQGIPMGLSSSVPLLMKERGASYEGLSLFSLVSTPFSLKLIWAPIVDSLFFSRMGRRKTWLVPVQILCGFVMIFGSGHIDEWIGDTDQSTGNKLNIEILTAFFMFLYFLMATQDIAVDGWALTMLSRRNVGYGSVCNSIGQAFGSFVANQGFIALSDEKWCHRHLGLTTGQGFVTLAGFMKFWGIIFIITTILIWIFKSEKAIEEGDEPEGLVETYRQVVAILKCPEIQLLSIILLTAKLPGAPIDAISTFRMQEHGMPKADIASIAPILMCIGFILPAILSSYSTVKPLNILLYGLIFRLVSCILSWGMVQYTTQVYAHPQESEPGLSFFVPFILVSAFHQITGTTIFIGQIAFFSKISDPTIGGTYMTLLATIANLGYLWTGSFVLWILPKLNYNVCILNDDINNQLYLNNELITCSNKNMKDICVQNNGKCTEYYDSFTVLVMLGILYGIVWLFIFKNTLMKLQAMPHSEWWVCSIRSKSGKVVSVPVGGKLS